MRNNKFFITAIAVFLIIILPFLCAKAQDTTLVKYEGGYGGTVRRLDSIEAGQWRVSTGLGTYWAKAEPKFDTIRVVMLVCDTLSIVSGTSKIVNGKLVKVGEERKSYLHPQAYWAYGYSVREFSGYYNGNTTQNAIYVATPFYQHIEYLGEDKKPLINKIVWMAKEVGK